MRISHFDPSQTRPECRACPAGHTRWQNSLIRSDRKLTAPSRPDCIYRALHFAVFELETVMRFTIGFIALLCLQLPCVVLAQAPVSPITPASACNPPPPAQSCQQLNCRGPCTEKWRDGQCLGGVCPKGIIAASPGTDLTIHNVSPELEQKIESLLNSNK